MLAITTILLISLSLIVRNCVDSSSVEEDVRAYNYMQQLNERTAERRKRAAESEWNYATNLTEYNLKRRIAVEGLVAKETKKDWLETKKFHWKSLKNPDLRRMFKIHSLIGAFALPPDKFEHLTNIVSHMQKVYSTAKVCDYFNPLKCDLGLEPEITHIVKTSRNPDELKHMWVEWRKAIGANVRLMFETYVDLSNEAARLDNFVDNTESWLEDYETADIRQQFQKLWKQVEPLYKQMHAYVRYRLRQKYGPVIVSERGPIPAHLLGNVWAQTWINIEDLTLPYPNVTTPNVTQEMIRQGYTPRKMFVVAENFFKSLNLSAMPASFWEKSVLERPADGRDLMCHPSAWDFYDNDVRIKMCTHVEENQFYVVHHEMGHAEYYLQYASQPAPYRQGANSGFHEAVGDTVALSVCSAKHLKKIGLLKEPTLDDKVMLNILFERGLEKLAFLPYGYLLDLWRWDVFSGEIPKKNWNCKFWEFKYEYQGVEPPVDRSEADFDPAAKYHTIADVPYSRYFVSTIIQFQFHRGLCIKAGQYVPGDPKKPLHNCDIYQNKEAGSALGRMLKLGASKPWPDAMEVLTGQREMDASGLLDYFEPLHTWLKKENRKNGAFIGWTPTRRVCTSSKAND